MWSRFVKRPVSPKMISTPTRGGGRQIPARDERTGAEVFGGSLARRCSNLSGMIHLFGQTPQPGEIIDTVKANPVLLAVLIGVGVPTVGVPLIGIVKRAMKAAIFGGLLSFGAWYWYFSIRWPGERVLDRITSAAGRIVRHPPTTQSTA